MTFDGETEKRYKQISLVAGETIYFNFLIDGSPIDETLLAYTPDEDGTYTVTFDPTSPRTIHINRIDEAVEDAYDEITRQRLIAHFSVINETTDLNTMATKLGHYELASQL